MRKKILHNVTEIVGIISVVAVMFLFGALIIKEEREARKFGISSPKKHQVFSVPEEGTEIEVKK